MSFFWKIVFRLQAVLFSKMNLSGK
jgi:hypothetical protein